MDEMIRYIFGELNRSGVIMTRMEKHMRMQRVFNRRLKVFMIASAACTVVSFINCCEANKMIDKLYSQVRELRGEKDELLEEIERLKHAN